MQTYTKREIANILGCTPRIVAEDSRYMNLKPTIGDRGRKLYNKNDLELIKQMRTHCADKANTRESFAPKAIAEIVTEPEVTKLAKKDKKELFPIFETDLDPLLDLDLLQRIADNKYLIPTNRIAPIINLSVGYLLSKNSYFYCGFLIKRETKENNQIYWGVIANNQ